MTTLIISRHAGAVAWLALRGITGRVIAQATPDDVRGQHVVGNLPLHLAALAASVTVIDMPDLTVEQRGKDLSPEEMDAAGATITSYIVRTAPEPAARDAKLAEMAEEIAAYPAAWRVRMISLVARATNIGPLPPRHWLTIAGRALRRERERAGRLCNCGAGVPVMEPHEHSPYCG